ncbi:RNA polymerase sigma factor [Actinomadura harenae]|uniref:RNA polymerase sigma factor n=1 Tax=Actinomadura harenae TaxID=2483351 RepID=A0A3M2LTR3_9ACTN|nr:RNA polymerase sigma factor [Actinomadura harenae]RMI39953.1 RNA polymerase sigma factor [Actinomadura harenae]
MPRTAAETPLTESPSPALDDLLERGRAQGRLSLDEVRRAFEAAGISPGQGRSILRELSEAGISLAGEDETAAKKTSRGTRTAKTPTTAGNAGKPGTGKSTGTTRKSTRATAAPTPSDPADITGITEITDTADPTGAAEDGEAPAAPARRATRKPAAKAGGAKTGTAKKAPAKKRATTAKTAVKAVPEPDSPADEDDADDDGTFELTEVEAADTETNTADLDDQSTTMGDSVHTYLKAIGRRQLLTAEQEVDLAKRIEAGLYAEHLLETGEDLPDRYRIELEWVSGDGRRAKAHMLEANLRLVVSVAKKYSDRGLSLLDVVQEGNLGLIRAVEKFDYSKGYKFSTYAMWWIRQAIQRGFADSARTIRLPVHVLEMLSKLSRIERDMHQRLGREPTPEELALELDKTPEQVRELLRTSRQPISLDSTIGEDGETRIGDLIEDTDSPEASELVDRQLMADQLRRTLDILNPREAKIMAMRFGLFDGTPRTLDEIGKALGLTRERIRQLEKESLSKLRHPSNAQPLLDFAV